MKRSLILLAAMVVTLACCRNVSAQKPARENVDLRRDGVELRHDGGHTISGPGAIQATPEMWFYEQERSRYEDPKAAVRRRAEYRAAQREYRIESLRWFGMSNSRPTANVTPFTGTYSPTWAGNTYDPFLWRPAGQTILVAPRGVY